MACLLTYCGLVIRSPDLSPDTITSALGFEPTRISARDPSSKYRHHREFGIWVWSTQDRLPSTDFMDHLNAIFAKLSGKEAVLESLVAAGCETSISGFWNSSGQGGPWLDLPTIDTLARLRLEIWWDIYFTPEEEQE